MKNFAYRATDYSGKIVRGNVASETVEAASQDVSAKGLYIISISETTDQFAFLRKFFLGLQIKRSDILEFTGSFSVMLKSGVPIITCLDDLIATTTNNAFKPVLMDIQHRLRGGSSVSTALGAQGAVFPDIIKTLVAVGEETGRLDESLREATEHLQRLQNLSSSIKKALMYPLFAFTATLGALIFWMLFVIPSLTSTLKSMGVKLPALTLFLINSSSLFQAHWKLLPLAFVLVPLAIFLLGKQPAIRYQMDKILVKMPVLEIIVFNKLLATFAEQFRMMIAADIPLKRLFDLIVPALGNEYFGVNLLKAKENILNGNTISESLEQQNIVPPLVISKIRIGETSGTLDKQLDFLAKYYTKKLDDATENLGKIIEPLVMTVIGGLFAIIIMGLLLPIYDLVSKVGKG
ncbi:MAG: type II secretion system F family protein [Geobacteraceae bacterium]|nr:type II secretion system F family protein [Geobacteraceae bacterium]NTW80793.1 type II secretion system F family protein [Geobacteraceae bacterium]